MLLRKKSIYVKSSSLSFFLFSSCLKTSLNKEPRPPCFPYLWFSLFLPTTPILPYQNAVTPPLSPLVLPKAELNVIAVTTATPDSMDFSVSLGGRYTHTYTHTCLFFRFDRKSIKRQADATSKPSCSPSIGSVF